MAQCTRSARSLIRDENRRIADARARMSVQRRIADLIRAARECTFLTQLRPCIGVKLPAPETIIPLGQRPVMH